MGTVATFYERLGVDRDASAAEIERAYRERVKETHPDVADADGEEFKRITVARDVLLEDETRRHYDRIGHARYVHDRLDPENWPDVGERPPPRRPRGRRRPRRRPNSRRRRDRRRARSVGDDSGTGGRSYTDRVKRNRARRGGNVRGSHAHVRASVNVSHSPQQNPYTPHDRDVVELAAVVQRALYGVLLCSFAITALVVAIAVLLLFSLG